MRPYCAMYVVHIHICAFIRSQQKPFSNSFNELYIFNLHSAFSFRISNIQFSSRCKSQRALQHQPLKYVDRFHHQISWYISMVWLFVQSKCKYFIFISIDLMNLYQNYAMVSFNAWNFCNVPIIAIRMENFRFQWDNAKDDRQLKSKQPLN